VAGSGAGDDEEDVNAEEASVQKSELCMDDHDEQNGDSPQALDVRPEGAVLRRRPGLITGGEHTSTAEGRGADRAGARRTNRLEPFDASRSARVHPGRGWNVSARHPPHDVANSPDGAR